MGVKPSKKAKALALGILCTVFAGSDVVAGTIARIRVQGNKRVESETVTSYIPLKIGDSFDQSEMDHALKELFSTGYFEDVKVAREGNDLVITVAENALINQIAFEGNSKLKDDILKEVIQIKSREVLSRAKVQEAQQNILEGYRRLGRFGATVDPKIIKLDDGAVNLVFEINEGDVTYVRKINFIGNKHIDSSKLESHLTTKRKRWYNFLTSNDVYDPSRFSSDQEDLRQFYREQGYLDFRIISATADLSPDRKDFFLTFTVEEGERYTLEKVDLVSHMKTIKAEELKELVTLKPGQYYPEKEVKKHIELLTTKVGSKGHAFAEIVPTLEKDAKTRKVKLTFEVKEGPRIYIERIDITGNERTHDAVIRRVLRIHEGDSYNASKIEDSKQQLKNLGYFKDVKIQVEQGSERDRARLVISVQEQSTGEFRVEGGFSTLEKVLGKLTFSERNFMGRGQIVGASVAISGKSQDFSASFTEPFFMDRRLAVGLSVFKTRSSYFSGYSESRLGLRPHLAYFLMDDLAQSWGYSFHQDDIKVGAANDFSGTRPPELPAANPWPPAPNSIPANPSEIIRAQAGKYLTSALDHSLSYDKRDSPISPTSGYAVILSNSLAGLGGDARYLKTSLVGAYYYSPFDDVVIKFKGSYSRIDNPGGKVLRVTDSLCFGNDSFRGFEFGGLGPRDVSSAGKDFVGATRALVGTIDMSFPIGLPNEFGVKGAIFTDFGTVWRAPVTGVTTVTRSLTTPATVPPGQGTAYLAPNVQDDKSIRVAVGVGITWDSPMGPLRIDYSIPVKKSPYDKTQRILIGFSTRF